MSFQLLCKGQLLPNLQSNRQGLGIRVCLLVRHRLRLPLYNGEPARMCAMLCCRLLQNPPHVSARSLLFLSLALSSLSPSALKLKSSMTNQCEDHHGEATDDCPYLSTRRCACPFPDTDRLIGFTSPTVPLKGDDLPCQATPTSLPRGLSSTIDDRPWQVPLTLADASQTICVTPTTCLLPANRETASLGSPHGIFQVRTVLAGGLACPVAAPPPHPFVLPHLDRRDDERGVPPPSFSMTWLASPDFPFWTLPLVLAPASRSSSQASFALRNWCRTAAFYRGLGMFVTGKGRGGGDACIGA